MQLVDAFLLSSAIAYFICLYTPKPTMRNRNFLAEKLAMLAMGLLLLGNLVFNLNFMWLLMGILWTTGAVLTYLGYTQWNVLWRFDVSDIAQMFMAFWDLLIAVACLTKLTFLFF